MFIKHLQKLKLIYLKSKLKKSLNNTFIMRYIHGKYAFLIKCKIKLIKDNYQPG